MNGFLHKQFQISNDLIRSMERDHVERMHTVLRLQEQVVEQDRRIKKLEATIDAMKVLRGEAA